MSWVADSGVRFDARVASGNADSRAASDSCRALYKPDGRAPGAGRRFQPIAEHRGDQRVSARPREGHDSAGRVPALTPVKVLVGRVARSRCGCCRTAR